ncbi:MAG: hypothetical protein IJM24_03510 [Clostridia bacterium]|nr:hypothetical protein [Clostridia bacterium]
MKTIFAYDLGTSGLKAVALDAEFRTAGSFYAPIATFNDSEAMAEQRPADWTNGFAELTSLLINDGFEPAGICISGHSLGVVPVFKDAALPEVFRTPLWSDRRAVREVKDFFDRLDRNVWYETTGCGLPTEMYPVFKLMWIKEHQPAVYEAAACFLGTKDYLNYLLTGSALTDRSYASGSGLYSLRDHAYRNEYVDAAGLDSGKLPRIAATGALVGYTGGQFARRCSLPEGVPVYTGGVDNVCATVGAGAVREGDTYISLGSSAQFVQVTAEPRTDASRGAFVWDMGNGKYASSFGTMSACTALKWAVTNVFSELKGDYAAFDALAAQAEPGSGGVLFEPDIVTGRCAWRGISAAVGRAELARSVLEGIAFSVLAASGLRPEQTETEKTLLICGGGSCSPIWMQIFADVFGMTVEVPGDPGNCAARGAAALSFYRFGAETPGTKTLNATLNTTSKEIHGSNAAREGKIYAPDREAVVRLSECFRRYLES